MTACPMCRKETPAETLDKLGGLCRSCLADFALEGAETEAKERPLPLAIGTVFRNLDILEVLGWGGMGVVYKCRQRDLNRLVALKVLNPSLGSDPEFTRRFNGEARALAALNHANIVQVFEFGKEADLYFLVMEHVDGTSLRETIVKGGMAPPIALKIVTQICVALEYAHAQGVIHRDIKPENILLSRGGDVKIADFGLAKILGEPESAQNVTRTDHVLGTPHYIAPEQMARKPVDHRADIYSLGVVFYEMLTGEVPAGRFAPPSQRVHVDVRLDEVVLKALDQEPGRRYQRASEMKTDVDLLSATAARPRRRSPLPWIAAGILLIAAAAAFFLTTRPEKKETAATPPPPPPVFKGISQWSWVNRGEVSETKSDEIVVTGYRDRPMVLAVPKGHPIGHSATLSFEMAYEVHAKDEPWILIMMEGTGPAARTRGLVLFPEGNHVVAQFQLEVPGNLSLIAQEPLPKMHLVQGEWTRIVVTWEGDSRLLEMTVNGEKAFSRNLKEGIDLAGPWKFGFGGAAKEIRIRNVTVRNVG